MNINQIARIASLVGEPARAAMLLELMDGRSLTANELAKAGRVSPQTASKHLAQMVEAGLMAVAQRGRHRYHRLSSGDVAKMLEGIMQIAGDKPPRRSVVPGPRDESMRMARMCYDHIAGRLGLAIAERLQADGAITFDGEAGLVTDRAEALLRPWGITLASAAPGGGRGRPYCRPCLDWSERRSHVAGRLGAMICAHCLDQGWLSRKAGARSLAITAVGVATLRDLLGLALWEWVTSEGQAPRTA
ncbi:transcriptional regulator [Rhodoferax koreense]|uniref:Transcriptional regulator n=1 Tax=Rhodoferax koreensis TaxID=1842727 RepID=A0A1P8JY62_9BURK|nr:winged helix-turn-helix domain-containing protein [Rhodoferax koreense]APW38678.1 transcriptional regulator [Rhodoferax koreense]